MNNSLKQKKDELIKLKRSKRKDIQYSNKAILTNKKGGRNVVTK